MKKDILQKYKELPDNVKDSFLYECITDKIKKIDKLDRWHLMGLRCDIETLEGESFYSTTGGGSKNGNASVMINSQYNGGYSE